MFALPVHEQVQGLDNLSMDVSSVSVQNKPINMRDPPTTAYMSSSSLERLE